MKDLKIDIVPVQAKYMNWQDIFYEYLKEMNPQAIARIIDYVDVNYVYKDSKYGPCTAFQIICSEIIDKKEKDIEVYQAEKESYLLCAKYILQSNLDLKYRDLQYNGRAIDIVIITEEIELIKMTIQKYQEQNLSFTNNDLITSLLIYNLEDNGTDDNEYVKIIELLLDNKVDINTLDYNTGEPPIYLAAKYKSKEIVALLCDYDTNNEMDLDFYHDPNGKSARDLIMKSHLYDGILPKKKCRYHLLYKYLKNKNSRLFIKHYKQEKLTREKRYSFLLRAVQVGVEETIEFLLQELSSFDDYGVLLRIACMKGYYRVVELLFSKTDDISYGIYLVRRVAIKDEILNNDLVCYYKVLELILENKYGTSSQIDLNVADKQNQTVLQDAIERKYFRRILILLNYGASLNTNESCLVLDIDPHLLQNHFDQCIRTYMEEDIVGKRIKRITKFQKKSSYFIDFTTVLRPRNVSELNIEMKDNITTILSEMRVFEHIATDADYRHLLMHPFAYIFIAMKWHKIRYCYIFDTLLYFIFTLLLIFYIFYSEVSILAIFILIFVVIIVNWEIIQIRVSPKLYVRNMENWLKISVILLACSLIILHSFWEQLEDIIIQVQAVTALLSIINFFFVLGHFPQLSTKVMMLRTVYVTLFKSFLTYSILLLAFITSFFILFRRSSSSFSRYLSAIFQTIIMSSGEYETGEVDLASYPISYFIIVLFILTISIGLLNLLTGLAVSDIQQITSTSELCALDTRIEQISRMEKILLRNFFIKHFNSIKCITLFADMNYKPIVEIDKNKNIIKVGVPEDIVYDETSVNASVIPLAKSGLNRLKDRRKSNLPS